VHSANYNRALEREGRRGCGSAYAAHQATIEGSPAATAGRTSWRPATVPPLSRAAGPWPPRTRQSSSTPREPPANPRARRSPGFGGWIDLERDRRRVGGVRGGHDPGRHQGGEGVRQGPWVYGSAALEPPGDDGEQAPDQERRRGVDVELVVLGLEVGQRRTGLRLEKCPQFGPGGRVGVEADVRPVQLAVPLDVGDNTAYPTRSAVAARSAGVRSVRRARTGCARSTPTARPACPPCSERPGSCAAMRPPADGRRAACSAGRSRARPRCGAGGTACRCSVCGSGRAFGRTSRGPRR